MKKSEAEFYDKLNELDDGPSMVIAYMACALSGAIVGFIIGYFVGWL